MRNKIVVLILVASMLALSIGGSSTYYASDDNTIITNSEKSVGLYQYEVATGEVTALDIEEVIKTNTQQQEYREQGAESVPEFVPDGLSSNPPTNISARLLLGEWEAVNNATNGQYRNTVHLAVSKGGKTYQATGFMIGPNAVATCGHVIYSNSNYATNIVVTPARANNSTPYGTANATHYVMSTGWIDDGDSEYDWGIILLDSNIGESVGYLGLRWQSASYNNTNIIINGYPGTVGNNTNNKIMHYSTGKISSSATRILYSNNTNLDEGASGGPVYFYSSSSGYTAIAIAMGATSTSNAFVRITEELYDIFVSYRNSRV